MPRVCVAGHCWRRTESNHLVVSGDRLLSFLLLLYQRGRRLDKSTLLEISHSKTFSPEKRPRELQFRPVVSQWTKWSIRLFYSKVILFFWVKVTTWCSDGLQWTTSLCRSLRRLIMLWASLLLFQWENHVLPTTPFGGMELQPYLLFFELFHNCKLCVTNRSLGSDAPSNNLTGLFPSAEIILF